MLRVGVSTLLWTWSVLFAFSACGGRTADTEQSIQATGGTLGTSTNASAATIDDQTSVGGSTTTIGPVQSGGEQGRPLELPSPPASSAGATPG